MGAPETPAGGAQPEFNSALANQIEALVIKKIESDALVLPTMPTVAVRCLDALKKPDFSFREVAALLEQDPLLAARCLRLATSAAYGGVASSTLGLSEALTRLGSKAVKGLLMEASAATVFLSNNPQISELAKKMWLHSVAVAALARDVCALTGGKEQDATYLAGLLHDIGKPIVAAILLEAERAIHLRGRRFVGSGEWAHVVRRTHRKVGVALAQKWNLPAPVAKCIKDCAEYDAADRTSLVNAVCFANALAKKSGFGVGDEDLDDANALVMIGRSLLSIDDQVITPLVTSLKSKVEKLYD